MRMVALTPGSWSCNSPLQSVWNSTARNHSCSSSHRWICCKSRAQSTRQVGRYYHAITFFITLNPSSGCCQTPPKSLSNAIQFGQMAWRTMKCWIQSHIPISMAPTLSQRPSFDTDLDLVIRYSVSRYSAWCPALLDFTEKRPCPGLQDLMIKYRKPTSEYPLSMVLYFIPLGMHPSQLTLAYRVTTSQIPNSWATLYILREQNTVLVLYTQASTKTNNKKRHKKIKRQTLVSEQKASKELLPSSSE